MIEIVSEQTACLLRRKFSLDPDPSPRQMENALV